MYVVVISLRATFLHIIVYVITFTQYKNTVECLGTNTKRGACYWNRFSLRKSSVSRCHRTWLQWHHNAHDGVSNYRRLDCLHNRLFKLLDKQWSCWWFDTPWLPYYVTVMTCIISWFKLTFLTKEIYFIKTRNRLTESIPDSKDYPYLNYSQNGVLCNPLILLLLIGF